MYYRRVTIDHRQWATVENCTTPTKAGCLFNIIRDPTEHHDLAEAMPDKVTRADAAAVDHGTGERDLTKAARPASYSI